MQRLGLQLVDGDGVGCSGCLMNTRTVSPFGALGDCKIHEFRRVIGPRYKIGCTLGCIIVARDTKTRDLVLKALQLTEDALDSSRSAIHELRRTLVREVR